MGGVCKNYIGGDTCKLEGALCNGDETSCRYKADGGKPRWDLLPLDAVEEVVKRFTHGAQKYEPGNWKRVPDAGDRYLAALLRHLKAHRAGERFDPDAPGLTHTSAVAWNALALVWFDLNSKEAGQ